MDKACVEVCPVDCIHFEEGSDKMLFIDPAECIDCGACQPACPVSAIFPEDDVPGDQASFININSLWYSDPAAARAQVGGGAAAPAADTEEAAVDAPVAEAAATENASADAPVAEVTETQEEPEPDASEAEAVVIGRTIEDATLTGIPAARPAQLSPTSVIMLGLFVGSAFLMLVKPGPTLIHITWAEPISNLLRIDNGQGVGLTVAALLPLAALFLLLFIVLQGRQLGDFAAKTDRKFNSWREKKTEWRRNEESRKYNLAEIVHAIAEDRFNFPSDEDPDLQSYINCPDPAFGIEPRGTGEKVFPDIVTVLQPGNYPVAIAQIESRETVTRDQADYVWALYQNQDCPLYIYVPAGLLAQAKDYARAANIKNVKFRTWRWSPNGMVVKEL